MVYIYTRVSSKKQDTQKQISELKEKYPNAIVVDETGSTLKIRPKLQALLEKLKEGDTLVVWKLDRLSRTTFELLSICNDLKNRRINLISTTQNVDIETPMGQMFIAALGMVAEMERNNSSERITLGIKAAKAKAEAEGKKYRPNAPKQLKSWARGPKPRSPEMIARLMELKKKGLTWQRIVEKLAFENVDWKVGYSTIREIYNREVVKRMV